MIVSVRMPGCDGRESLPSSRIVNRPSRPRIRRLMSVVKVAVVKVVDAKSASAASVSRPFPLADRVAAVSAADPEAGPAPETSAENAMTPANAAAAARGSADRRRWCIAVVLLSTACGSLRYRRAMRSRGVRGHRMRARKSDNLPKVPIRRARHVAVRTSVTHLWGRPLASPNWWAASWLRLRLRGSGRASRASGRESPASARC